MQLDQNDLNGSGELLGRVKIKVAGVGGGGVNAIRRMAGTQVPGVELLCVNTDTSSLGSVPDVTTVAIGEQRTRGLGAGGNPGIGRSAAEETQERLRAHLEGADLVFIAAGMGGGTGTGAAPIVAQIAREAGALTVGVVTTPFGFEGSKRKQVAAKGLQPLREIIDTLIVVSNDRLLSAVDRHTSVQEAFGLADRVMVHAMLGVSRIINEPGDVNIDFADICAVIEKGGLGLMAIGIGDGDRRVLKAAKSALANPLLDVSAEGARGLLFVVSGGPDVTLGEMGEAGTFISEVVDPEAQIFFGMTTDAERSPGRDVEMVLIATRLPRQPQYEGPAEPESVRRLKATVPIYQAETDLPPFLRKGWLDPNETLANDPVGYDDWIRRGRLSSSS